MVRPRKQEKETKVSGKIEARGSGFQATVIWTPEPGNHRRERRSFPTELEAERWIVESKERIQKGLEPEKGDRASTDGKPRTIGEMIKYVYNHRWHTQSAGAKQRRNAEECAAIIGSTKQLSKIGKFEIDTITTALLKQHGGATANRKLAAFRTCLSEAVVLGVIPHRPVWKQLKESEGRVARVSREREQQFLRWCDRMSEHDMADIILWSIHTGTRPKETFQVRLNMFFGNKCVLPGDITKNKKSRSIPLPPKIAEMVERRRADAPHADTLLFDGWKQRSFEVVWDKMREHLNLDEDPDCIPYAMRHEFCSRLAERGASASYIQMLAGHQSLSVSQRYVHLFGSESEEMAARFMVDQESASNVVAMAKALARKGSGPA